MKKKNQEYTTNVEIDVEFRMDAQTENDTTADLLYRSTVLDLLFYSDKLIIIFMFIAGVKIVDLLSIFFIVFPFLVLFFGDKLDHMQSMKWWYYAQVYNWLCLCLYIIYQLPVIPAPDARLNEGFVAWEHVIGLVKLCQNNTNCGIVYQYGLGDNAGSFLCFCFLLCVLCVFEYFKYTV